MGDPYSADIDPHLHLNLEIAMQAPFTASTTLRSTFFGFALMAAALTLAGIDALAQYSGSPDDQTALMALSAPHSDAALRA